MLPPSGHAKKAKVPGAVSRLIKVTLMFDAIFLAIGLAFLAATVLYVVACERL
jgi:hypothetical protein